MTCTPSPTTFRRSASSLLPARWRGVGEEAERLKLARALVVATPGSGARLGRRSSTFSAPAPAGLHAQAVVHVPKAVAEAGLAAARDNKADGLIAVGGGAAIGLAKAIARETGLPILALPTTYSGSEATPIFGMTDGERKITGRDVKVLPRTIVYDPDLTLGLPAAVSAASGMNAIAHCVEALLGRRPHAGHDGAGERSDAAVCQNLPAVVADGADRRGARGMPHRRLARRNRAQRPAPRCTTSSPTCSAASACRTPRPTRSSCRMSCALISKRRRKRRRACRTRSAATTRRPRSPRC